MAQPGPIGFTILTGAQGEVVGNVVGQVLGGNAAELVANKLEAYKAIVFQLTRVTIGILRAELEVKLPRNAVVTRYPVALKATVAASTQASSIGQLRSYYAREPGNHLVTVIVDFGTPRTVAAISASPNVVDALQDKFTIYRVLTWTGAAFDATRPAYTAPFKPGPYQDDHTYQRNEILPQAPSTYATTILSEVRTSKLQIDMVTSLAPEAAAAQVYLTLPDLPARLALSIDDGPPVWTHVDVAAPRNTTDKTVNDVDWSSEGQRRVDLAAAFAALTGDPEAPIDDVTFKLALTSEVPGVLDLQPGSTLGAAFGPQVQYLARIPLGAGGQRRLDFDQEGEQPITLPLPPWAARVKRATLRATAKVPERRVLPAVGPAIDPVATLVLDAAHAITAQLAVTLAEPLVELFGVRVPLTAGPEGAEARVILLTPGEEPGAPLEAAVSAPVEFAANAGGVDVWQEFTFEQPVPVVPGAPAPWAAVIVSRGRLDWSLGISDRPLRRGPPAGPWQRLPGVITSRPNTGARIRVVGRAEDEAPVAPFQLQLRGGNAATAQQAITPTAKGAAIELAGLDLAVPADKQLQLWVRARTTTALTIETLDLTLERG